MRRCRRRTTAYRVDLDRLEARQLLSAAATAAHVAPLPAHAGGAAAVVSPIPLQPAQGVGPKGNPVNPSMPKRFLAYRITIPKVRPVNLVPPFQHVLVQKLQPVPGRMYNILFVVVKNGTSQTFTAADNFKVRLPGYTGTHRVVDSAFPVLTGNEVWKPNTWVVFYAMSKKYYPLSPQVAAGFQLDAGGRSSTMVPGPSGIFLRLIYDPARFPRQLDQIVAYGQGAQGGAGPPVGLPDTAINVLVAARTDRQDFAGHF